MLKPLVAAALAAAVVHPAQADSTLLFQHGLNGYAGAVDTMVRSAGAAEAYGSLDYISVDGDDGSPGLQPNHGLLRFDDLFGNGAGQIQAGQVITSATLTLQVSNPGSGLKLHDMLTPWSESSTWSSLVAGVQADGIEASLAALQTVGANNSAENVAIGSLMLDVTASLLAAQGGAPLYGWALIPFVNGTNGIDFATREFAVQADRPLLSVQVSPVPEPANVALMLAGLLMIGTTLRHRLQA